MPQDRDSKHGDPDEDDGAMIEIPIEVDPPTIVSSIDHEPPMEIVDQNVQTAIQYQEETFVQKVGRAAVIMRDGNEIQRISIVRNLPSLTNEDADECLIRLIPVVQDVLCGTGSGSAGLELHFEASQAYKDIILVQHQRLQRANALREQQTEHNQSGGEEQSDPSKYTIDLGLCSQILRGISQNIESQDSMACTAWLDTLLEVVDHLPQCLIKSRVLPMAVQKAQQLNSVQARLTATKLFGRLTTKLDSNEIKSEIVPLVQALCQDSDANVRASICQQLPLITKCLQLSELNSTILPLVIEFSKDDDEQVREANLETLAALIETFDDETCGQILVPLLRKFVDDILNAILPAKKSSEDEEDKEKKTPTSNFPPSKFTTRSIVALAKNYGLLCHSLERYLNPKQKRWFLERFCDLASLGADDSSEDAANNNDTPKMEFVGRKQDAQIVLLTCRRHAAFNFPAMVQLANNSSEHLIKDLLLPQFKKLCQDSETEVRVRVAAGFHEFAKSLGTDAVLLIDSFVDLVYSGDPDVIASLTARLADTLEYVYRAGHGSNGLDANGNLIDQQNASTSRLYTQLTRILLACNRLIRNGSNWRSHEQLLTAFACLSQYISNDELCQSFVPMMKEEVVNARAVPCRIAALRTLIKWTRDMKRTADVQGVVKYCMQTLSTNRTCHKRVLFLDACEMSIEYLSKQFFKENFFSTAMQMVQDPVLNVRMRFCKLLPMFKSCLNHQTDTDRLITLESSVKTLLNTDNQGYMGEILKKVINELAHADSIDHVVTRQQSTSPPKENTAAKPPVASAAKKKAEVAPMPQQASTQVEAESKKKVEEEPEKVEKDRKVDSEEKEAIGKEAKESAETKGNTTATSARSTSPPPIRRPGSSYSSSTSTSTSSITGKKTAVVQPRQVLMRSPSPRPPLNQYSGGYQKDPPVKTSTSTSTTSSSESSRASASSSTSSTSRSTKSTTDDSDARDYIKSRPPRPSTTSASSARSEYTRASSSASTDRSSLLSKSSSSSTMSNDDSTSERIVPIRMVDSERTTSIRPPTPVTYRRSSRDTSSSYISPLSRSSSSSSASASSLRRSSAAADASSRTIPVIRTGTVSSSIERFEKPGSSSSSSTRRDSGDSGLSSSASRRYSSAVSSASDSLSYNRAMNRSFSSFGRDSLDSNNNTGSRYSDRKDYSMTSSSPSPVRRSAYSSTSSSTDRSLGSSSYALSRVRSGSSLASRSLR